MSGFFIYSLASSGLLLESSGREDMAESALKSNNLGLWFLGGDSNRHVFAGVRKEPSLKVTEGYLQEFIVVFSFVQIENKGILSHHFDNTKATQKAKQPADTVSI